MELDPTTWPPLLWLIAAAALLAGYALGALFSRRGRNPERIRQLERQLDDTRDEFESYREQVSGHFTDTSKHLRDLALQYRTVYEHLADGARTLCPDSTVPIEARGLAKELLPASAHEEDAAEAPSRAGATPEPDAPQSASTARHAEGAPASTTENETAPSA